MHTCAYIRMQGYVQPRHLRFEIGNYRRQSSQLCLSIVHGPNVTQAAVSSILCLYTSVCVCIYLRIKDLVHIHPSLKAINSNDHKAHSDS